MFSNVFGDLMSGFTTLSKDDWVTTVDKYKTFVESYSKHMSKPSYSVVSLEDRSGYVVEVELAGYSKKDVSVSVEDGILTIESKMEDKDWKIQYTIGSTLDRGEITSKMVNGLLSVTIPYRKEVLKDKEKIDIKIE